MTGRCAGRILLGALLTGCTQVPQPAPAPPQAIRPVFCYRTIAHDCYARVENGRASRLAAWIAATPDGLGVATDPQPRLAVSPSRTPPASACGRSRRGRPAPPSPRRSACRPSASRRSRSASLRHSTPAVARDVVVEREAPLGLGAATSPGPRRGCSCERLRVALAAHDERLGAHRARDDPQLALARAHRALAGDEHVLAEVVLPRHVVVVAVDRLQLARRTAWRVPSRSAREHVASSSARG